MMKFKFNVRTLGAVLILAVLGWYLWDDPSGGAQVLEQIRAQVGILAALPVVYLSRRWLAESLRGRELADLIRDGNTAAGLAYLGLCLLAGMIFLALSGRALAGELPGQAAQYLPILQAEQRAHWPSMTAPSMLAAQVEQESGWRVRATLKTEREEGVGFGQFTRAYDARGALRFDALAEVSRLDPSLSGWTWADRYNPLMQLRGVVVKNRDCYEKMTRIGPQGLEALALCDAAYNQGLGGVYARRRLCAQAHSCDPNRWAGNVELYSTQSRVRWHGYGASAFDITNTHVLNVMHVRRKKYVRILGA